MPPGKHSGRPPSKAKAAKKSPKSWGCRLRSRARRRQPAGQILGDSSGNRTGGYAGARREPPFGRSRNRALAFAPERGRRRGAAGGAGNGPAGTPPVSAVYCLAPLAKALSSPKMPKPHKHVGVDQIKASFCMLPARQQLRVLAEVLLFVSFHAQTHCDPEHRDLSAAYQKLCSLNELQLIIAKQIVQLAASRPLGMPQSALIDQLFGKAQSAGFQKKLASAFQQCLADGTVPVPNPSALIGNKGGRCQIDTLYRPD